MISVRGTGEGRGEKRWRVGEKREEARVGGVRGEKGEGREKVSSSSGEFISGEQVLSSYCWVQEHV